MSSTSSPTVPAGQYPPLAVVTPDDHEAWIVIATALGLAISLFFATIRVIVRSTLGHGFGVDDLVLGAATVFALIQSSIILGACSKGLGKALRLVSAEAQEEVQKLYYTSNIFFLLAIGTAKISVICFLRRISRMGQHRRVFNIALGVMAAWAFGSIMAISLQCNLGHPWFSVNDNCPEVVSMALDPEKEIWRYSPVPGSTMANRRHPRYRIRGRNRGLSYLLGL